MRWKFQYIIAIVLTACCFSISAQTDFSLLDSIQRLNIRAQDSTRNIFNRKQDAALALKLARTVQYNAGAYEASSLLGKMNWSQSQYQEALESFLQADVFASELGDQEKIAETALYLGQILLELEDTEAAMAYFQESEAYYSEENDTASLGKIYTGIGLVMSHRNDREKALEFFIRALSLYDQGRYNNLKITPLLEIGDNYLETGIPDLAEQYFERAFDLASGSKDYRQLCISLSKLAQVNIFLKEFDHSDSLLNESLAISRQFDLKRVRADIYSDMAAIYEATNDYQLAYRYFRKYTAMEDTLRDDLLQAEVAALQVEYETERKEKELLSSQNKIMRLEQRNKISQLWVLIITLGLLSLLVVLYLLRSRYRIQQRLAQSDIKAREMESVALKRELDFKNMDLTNLAIDISRKNEFANEILDKLHELEKRSSGDTSKKIRDLIHFTSNHAKINEDLEKLQLNAEHVNQEFFNKLRELYPNLTKNERSLCGLIRLNLSTKEIAAIKNITPKSVEMIRYRLRKKLELEPRANVAAFLQSL